MSKVWFKSILVSRMSFTISFDDVEHGRNLLLVFPAKRSCVVSVGVLFLSKSPVWDGLLPILK